MELGKLWEVLKKIYHIRIRKNMWNKKDYFKPEKTIHGGLNKWETIKLRNWNKHGKMQKVREKGDKISAMYKRSERGEGISRGKKRWKE